MHNIGIILGTDNTLILNKGKSLLRFNEISDIKKILLKRLILFPRFIIFSNNKEDKSKIKRARYCEKVKAILISRGIDITKTSATMVINVEDDINIGIVSLGKVIINEKITISKKDKIVKDIKKVYSNLNKEIINDIKEKGIILSGSNDIINEIKDILRKELDTPIFVSDGTESDLIKGINLILNDISLLNY